MTGNIANAGAISVEGNDSGGHLGRDPADRQPHQLGRGHGASATAASASAPTRSRATCGSPGAVAVQGEGSVGVQLGEVDGALVLQNAITRHRLPQRRPAGRRGAGQAGRRRPEAGRRRPCGSPATSARACCWTGRRPTTAPTDTDEDDDGVTDTAEGTAAIAVLRRRARRSTSAATARDHPGRGRDRRPGLRPRQPRRHHRQRRERRRRRHGACGSARPAAGRSPSRAGSTTSAAAIIAAAPSAAQSTAVLLNAGAVVPALAQLRHDRRRAERRPARRARHRRPLGQPGAGGELRASSSAIVTPATGVTQTGKTIAIDLSANTAGATVRQAKFDTADTPAIGGDVLFGSGDDRLELLAGTLAGTMSFGAGADTPDPRRRRDARRAGSSTATGAWPSTCATAAWRSPTPRR